MRGKLPEQRRGQQPADKGKRVVCVCVLGAWLLGVVWEGIQLPHDDVMDLLADCCGAIWTR